MSTSISTVSTPCIRRLTIERFRGIKKLDWLPKPGLNILLGGGDTGKTTILEAIALLLSPTNNTVLSDSDYFDRKVADGFVLEGIFSLPDCCGVGEQPKHLWPWYWDGRQVTVPGPDEGALFAATKEPVYIFRVRGTEEFDLSFEIIQPNGDVDVLGVGLRRRIGLVRLSGEDRNDRDLRLVQGSALDRLINDRTLRARLGSKFAAESIQPELGDSAKETLKDLDDAFKNRSLPSGLDIGVTGSQSISLNALIGLTAQRGSVHLPLSSWGTGTRRLAALEISSARQSESPITLVDEIERGLEPYRQRELVQRLQETKSQVFVTTHNPTPLRAASNAAVWYLDATGNIGELSGSAAVNRHRERDPESLLSRLVVFVEGKTECGFVDALFRKGIGENLLKYGIWISDAGGNRCTLELLEAFRGAGLTCGGFADDEGLYSGRWNAVKITLKDFLFRWQSGCTEEQIIRLVPDERLRELIEDPLKEKTGDRLRTLAIRCNQRDKDFESLKAVCTDLRSIIIDAATGAVPQNVQLEASQKKEYQKHCQCWFKSVEGGKELFDKVTQFGLWPNLKGELLPFVNAARTVAGLPIIADLS